MLCTYNMYSKVDGGVAYAASHHRLWVESELRVRYGASLEDLLFHPLNLAFGEGLCASGAYASPTAQTSPAPDE